MLIAASQKCSAGCEEVQAWTRRTEALVAKVDSGKRAGRDPEARRKKFASLCDPPKCSFLARSSRMRMLGLLDLMDFRGASAEVGVWQGAMSLSILRAFAKGGTHLSVDPWAGHMGGCDALQDRHCAMRKLRNGTLVKRANDKKFDAMYEMVRDKLTGARLITPRSAL